MDKETELRIKGLEYQIRKKERGMRVLWRQKAKAGKIIEYGEAIEKLQDELEFLTTERYFSAGRWKILKRGRREPKSPRWPL